MKKTEPNIGTHRSGLASILLKKSPVWGYKELSNLFKTTSVSTLKYCMYDATLNTPLQLFAGCSSNVSAWITEREIVKYVSKQSSRHRK